MTVAAPSGLVTFLFTDVEGSTRRWEKDADAMRAALADHDEVLRTAIEAHGGWLFKHTGEGVLPAFGSPTAAVDAAVAAQRSNLLRDFRIDRLIEETGGFEGRHRRGAGRSPGWLDAGQLGRDARPAGGVQLAVSSSRRR